MMRNRKWIKKALLFERSEFQRFPIFCFAALGTRRATKCGRLSLLPFFGEAKKGSGCRAAPGQQSVVQR